jgi:hypothetical protein
MRWTFVQYRLPLQLRYCACPFELPLRFNRCPVLRKPFTIEQLAVAIDRIIPLRDCDVPQPQLHNGHVRWLAQDRCVGAHSYDVRISICPAIAIGLTRKWRTQINIPHPSVSPRSIVCLNSDPNPDCAIKVDHGLPLLHDWAATAKRRVYGLPSPRRRMHKDRRRTPRRTIKCSAQFSSAFRNANACHD